MARATFRLPAADFDALVGLDITAEFLDLTVEAVEDLTEVTVELTGPSEVVEGARAFTDQMWVIDIPAPAAGVSVGAVSGRNMVVGQNFGTVIQAGNIYGGSVFMSGGSISIGGQAVAAGPQIGHEPIRAVARVPRSAALSARITTGSVVTRGRMGSVTVTGADIDSRIEHADRVDVNTSSGDTTIVRAETSVTVHTSSGDITIRSGGSVATLRTMSGDVDYTAGTDDSRVSASTMSGDVTVVRSGFRVRSSVSSMSGRVREW